MPICEGCGASYENTFKFCPNCGRAKSVEVPASLSECLNCGHYNNISFQFCQNCGKPIIQLCRQCGQKNALAVSYCGNCGIKLSEAKFTLSESFIEKWRNEFIKHPGHFENVKREGLVELKYQSIWEGIDKSLGWPFPVTYGKDIRVFLLPIHEYYWAVKSATYDNKTIKIGGIFVDRISIMLYDFKNSSRVLFFLDAFSGAVQSGNSLLISFKNDAAIQLDFQIPMPSKTKSNVFGALGIGAEILGGIISATVFEETETERQIKLLREDVQRSNPNYMSNAEAIKYQYNLESDAAQSYIPMYKTFFDEIVHEKFLLGIK